MHRLVGRRPVQTLDGFVQTLDGLAGGGLGWERGAGLRHQTTPCPTNHRSPPGCPRRGPGAPAPVPCPQNKPSALESFPATWPGPDLARLRARSPGHGGTGPHPTSHSPQLVRRSALAKSDRHRGLIRHPAGPTAQRPSLTTDGRPPTSTPAAPGPPGPPAPGARPGGGSSSDIPSAC